MDWADQLSIINDFRKTAPVNVELMARAIGVPVAYSNLGADTSGMIERVSGDRFRIVVNENDPETRQRFTIAHELGHYMLHRHLLGEGVGEDRAYRSTNAGRYQNTLIGKTQEIEANKFAVNVLMPPDLIEQSRPAMNGNPKAMAQHFKVSEQSMCIRLGVPYEPGFNF